MERTSGRRDFLAVVGSTALVAVGMRPASADERGLPGKFYGFEEKGFDKLAGTVDLGEAQYTPDALHRFARGVEDKFGSMRWDLAKGVVVVLYENADGNGHQFVMWGKNEVVDMEVPSFFRANSSFRWIDLRCR